MSMSASRCWLSSRILRRILAWPSVHALLTSASLKCLRICASHEERLVSNLLCKTLCKFGLYCVSHPSSLQRCCNISSSSRDKDVKCLNLVQKSKSRRQENMPGVTPSKFLRVGDCKCSLYWGKEPGIEHLWVYLVLPSSLRVATWKRISSRSNYVMVLEPNLCVAT